MVLLKSPVVIVGVTGMAGTDVEGIDMDGCNVVMPFELPGIMLWILL
jgi:hypothetical protein